MELKIHGREKVWAFALEIADDASATIVFPKYAFPRGGGVDLKEAVRAVTDQCRRWLSAYEHGTLDNFVWNDPDSIAEIKALAEDIVYAWEKKFGNDTEG